MSQLANPLAPPCAESPSLRLFLNAFHIDRLEPPRLLLAQVGEAFSRLPYENLTKIIKAAACGSIEEARRQPAEVLSDHVALGTGGTCFSLTATLLHLVRALGWQAEPILADRPYGPDTHCALLVWIDGKPHLIDPGFLITSPVPLPTETEVRIPTAFNVILLRPREGGRRVELHTVQQGQQTLRLTFKIAPVDAAEFLRVWDQSFDWDMMNYPLLTRVTEGRQLFLNKNRLQVRSTAMVQRVEVDPSALAEKIEREFGIASAVSTRALEVLKRKGVRIGGTGTS